MPTEVSGGGRQDQLAVGGLETIACSNFDQTGRQHLADRVKEWSQDRQASSTTPLSTHACHGHIEAAELLLKHGAEINVVPGGFDYAGNGAALRQRSMDTSDGRIPLATGC